jgi:hypothetical protein
VSGTGLPFFAASGMGAAMPLKRRDPHDVAKNAQELDHRRISFERRLDRC